MPKLEKNNKSVKKVLKNYCYEETFTGREPRILRIDEFLLIHTEGVIV